MRGHKLKIVLVLAILLLLGLVNVRFLTRPRTAANVAPPASTPPANPPRTNMAAKAAAEIEITNTVFSSFGPAKTFLTNTGWAVGVNAHAEWFVPAVSGRLSVIEVAVEPNYVRKGRERTATDVNLFLAQDENGFPGKTLEEFSVVAEPPSSPAPTNSLKYRSVVRPALQAGVKYWLGARCPGPGSWVWRFNDQNLTQVSAYEPEPGKWKSAGNGRNGALSITVTSNP